MILTAADEVDSHDIRRVERDAPGGLDTVAARGRRRAPAVLETAGMGRDLDPVGDDHRRAVPFEEMPRHVAEVIVVADVFRFELAA